VPKIDLNWGKHCCCCWFGQKWLSNHIKNDSRIYVHPQHCSSLDSDRGFRKESCVHVSFHTPWYLSKGKIESHLAKTLSQWPMQTKIFLTKLLREMRPGVLPMTPKQSDKSSEWVGETSPWPKLKFQRSRIKNMLIIFFYSQGIVHKEFVPEGKAVYPEFYKGVMDHLLKRIQWVCPALFWPWDFFLLHNNVPTHKAASVCQFLTKKMLQPFITSCPLQIYLHQTIFCSPSWKWS